MSQSSSAGKRSLSQSLIIDDEDLEVIDLTQELSEYDGKADKKERKSKKMRSKYVDDEAPKEKEKGCRHFVFTLFLEGTIEDHKAWCEKQHETWQTNEKIARWSMQVEEAPETKRTHVQGYLGLNNKTTMTYKSFQKKVLETDAYVKQAMKPKEAFEYCTKSKSRLAGPWIHGGKPEAGARNDIKEFLKDAKEKMNLPDLQEKHCTVEARYTRYWDRALVRYNSEPKRTIKTKCLIWWGDAGTGKTWRVREWVEQKLELNWDTDVYSPLVSGDNKQMWWDSYNGQKVVLMDEFAPSSMNLNLFKNLAGNATGYKVQSKGGSHQFRSEWIVMCSNGNPRTWWGLDKPDKNHEYKAFSRRVTECKWFQIGPLGLQNIEDAWKDPIIVDDPLYA